tara:strand:- start:5790 stop:6323 length:534 start_codon:yes stop_codon:yes gene_type:complete
MTDAELLPIRAFANDLSAPMNSLTPIARRGVILKLEKEISALDNAVFGNAYPLKHTFSDGFYVRELTVPPNVVATGRLHKYDHPSFILRGTIRIITEDGGLKEIVGPESYMGLRGTKRAFFTLTEVVWATVHLNPKNTTDIDELEARIFADSYKEYNEFIERKPPWYKRILKLILMR